MRKDFDNLRSYGTDLMIDIKKEMEAISENLNN